MSGVLKYRWLLLSYAGTLLTAASLVLGGAGLVTWIFAAATTLLPAIVFLFDNLAAAFTKFKQAGYDSAAACVVEKRPDVSFERRVLLSMIAVMIVAAAAAYQIITKDTSTRSPRFFSGEPRLSSVVVQARR